MIFKLNEQLDDKKLGKGATLNTDAGDVEYNVAMFNNMNGTASLPICEDMNNYSLITVEDILSGATGNMDDAELDSDIKLFTRIARVLKVNSMDYITCYVDAYHEYDPQYIEGSSFVRDIDQKQNAKQYTVNNIDVVAEYNKNGNVYLYFFDDAAATAYLSYVDSINNTTEEET